MLKWIDEIKDKWKEKVELTKGEMFMNGMVSYIEGAIVVIIISALLKN